MRPRLARAASVLRQVSEALGRVSQEYHELGLVESGRPTRKYDVLIYASPIQIRDRKRLIEALGKAIRRPVPTEEMPAAVPFRNGAFIFGVESVTAEYAASTSLRLLREALQECNLTMEKIRLEVEPNE